ncbi:ABC transporter substrate-binding protein [Paenibacillus piri]|uniref:ABC transporter substrate-binding protein n=2 Tax=Paenibacillus piri TaxID=2547395 RepID=A0A4R5KTV6_9BACL|nr:ABC transporter substrate-binding protein [Paenibacillus piri]TDF98330.1 ABC transporter substrate-binding protein [Paenibacillus piri]
MRKKGVASLMLASVMAFAVACNGGSAPEQGGAKAESSTGPKKVVFWHAMGGANTKVVDQMVADFNGSQNKVKVEAIYQGTYDELLNKLKTSMGSNEGPTVVQMYEIGSRFMIDSKAITPMQKFIDADKYDVSQLEPNIIGYYTIDNKLYSMPFNTSNPLLYFNKDIMKASGLDPEKPMKTFEDVKQAAEAIAKSGKANGITIQINGWFMEQLFANQNAEYVNNGNGRKSLATESLLNTEPGLKVLTWWKSMLDSKALINLGRNAGDTRKAFASGQVGIMLDTTAALKGIVEDASGKFEVGTGFLPKPADVKEGGGIVVGGASLWMMNNRSDSEQQSAWEFIKFLSSPKEQAYWHISTGYFPVTVKAYDEQSVKDNMKKYPQFQTAVDQLHQTKLTLATQGGVMGVFPEARQLVEGAVEEVLNNKKTPKEALDATAKTITSKIQQYNKTVKQ